MADETLGYCTRCGTPRNPQEIANCPACGELDWDPYTVTPTIVPPDVRFDLPPPWDGTRCEWGRMIGIHGPKGIGKSTLMAQLCRVGFPHPDQPAWGGGAWWITCEESGNQVRTRNGRIGLPNITVHHIDPHQPFVGMAEFYKRVARNPPKVVIVDSASALGQNEGVKICVQLKTWAQINQAIVGVIVQHNAKGDPFGLEELSHLVDAWGFIASGQAWLRMVGLEKNRFGDLFNKSWRFGDGGTIVIPSFEDRLMTVVGAPGSYELLAYPYRDTKGKLHQVWEFLQDLDAPSPATCEWAGIGVLPDFIGYASAGVRAPFKDDGFEVPDDWPDRRRYAEIHGLPWLDPRTLPSLARLQKRARFLAQERRARAEEDELDAEALEDATEPVIPPRGA